MLLAVAIEAVVAIISGAICAAAVCVPEVPAATVASLQLPFLTLLKIIVFLLLLLLRRMLRKLLLLLVLYHPCKFITATACRNTQSQN